MQQQKTEMKNYGEKSTVIMPLRFTPSQRKMIELLSKSSGFGTVSSWARFKLLGSSLSQDKKLNEIIDMLKKEKETKNE